MSIIFRHSEKVIVVIPTRKPFVGTVKLSKIKYLTDINVVDVSIRVDDLKFTNNGYYNKGDTNTSVFHCTNENINAINLLYGCNLKLPKSYNEIADSLFDYQTIIMARGNDYSYESALKSNIGVYEKLSDGSYQNINNKMTYDYLIPINPKTLQPMSEDDLREYCL